MIVLGIFLPVEAITFYNVAFKVYEFLHYGLSLVASTLVPVVSELEAAMDKRRIAMLFERATRYSVVLLWPVFMLAYIYTGDVIALWMGQGFESSVTLARLFYRIHIRGSRGVERGRDDGRRQPFKRAP